MDAIAARTATTRALISYHFGGKERSTWRCSSASTPRSARPRAASTWITSEPRPPSAGSSSSPSPITWSTEGFVRLVVAENQAEGGHFRKSKAMRSLNRPIIDRLARVIARGQADGTFRADADPSRCT